MHVMKTFKMYCLSNYQIYNTVLFTIVTMLHILSPEFICLVIQSLYLLVRHTHFFSNPPPPASGNHWSILYISQFILKHHTRFVFLCLTYFT